MKIIFLNLEREQKLYIIFFIIGSFLSKIIRITKIKYNKITSHANVLIIMWYFYIV
jgi:hypothetical protein